MTAAERIGRTLGLRCRVMPRWGELQLREEEDGLLLSDVFADPTGVDMDRVVAATTAIEDVEAGRLAPNPAVEAIKAIAQAPPAPTWLFALAAGLGAAALGVIFGVEHLSALLLIFGSAAVGAHAYQT